MKYIDVFYNPENMYLRFLIIENRPNMPKKCEKGELCMLLG
jgi:hypothetical protein